MVFGIFKVLVVVVRTEVVVGVAAIIVDIAIVDVSTVVGVGVVVVIVDVVIVDVSSVVGVGFVVSIVLNGFIFALTRGCSLLTYWGLNM